MTWEDKIVGQQRELTTVYDIISNGRYPHATIISGKSGYGTLPLAMIIIKSLCCVNISAKGPCNSCPQCKRIDELQHPDLHIAFPVVGVESKRREVTTSDDFIIEWRETVLENPYLSYSDWAKKISKTSTKPNINATEVAKIIQQLSLQSFSGNIKIQVIWMAQMVGDQSNKLLKIIEEPPDSTYFFLIVEDLDSILPTILSRCQQINVQSIDHESLSQVLMTRHQLSAENASAVASFSGGDYAEAISLLNINHAELLSQLLSWWVICKEYDIMSMIEWTSQYASMSSLDEIALLKYGLKIVKGILHYRLLADNQLILTQQELAAILQIPFLTKLSIDQLHRLSEILSDLMYGTERYLHAKCQMFNSCLLIESTFNSNVMNAV